MSKDQPRDTQTKVKHEILGEYLLKWGYIISSVLNRIDHQQISQSKPFVMRFVYVDCFAHTGRYAPEDETGGPAYGSPIIGIECLDRIRSFASDNAGFVPEVFSILIEERASYFDELKETLNIKGYGPRVKETSDFFSLQTGEIAIVRGDSQSYLNELLEFTGRNFTWSFYLLDPYGPKGIPMKMVASIISQNHSQYYRQLCGEIVNRASSDAAKLSESLPNTRN